MLRVCAGIPAIVDFLDVPARYASARENTGKRPRRFSGPDLCATRLRWNPGYCRLFDIPMRYASARRVAAFAGRLHIPEVPGATRLRRVKIPRRGAERSRAPGEGVKRPAAPECFARYLEVVSGSLAGSRPGRFGSPIHSEKCRGCSSCLGRSLRRRGTWVNREGGDRPSPPGGGPKPGGG